MRRDRVTQELNLLQRLQHPHIVTLIDTYETPSSYALVLEMWVNSKGVQAELNPTYTCTALSRHTSDLMFCFGFQGRPRPSAGLHRELGESDWGEGGLLLEERFRSFTLLTQLQNSTLGHKSESSLFHFPPNIEAIKRLTDMWMQCGHVQTMMMNEWESMRLIFALVTAWEPAGVPHRQRPANSQAHRLRWCRAAQQCPLCSPSAGQPWVRLPRAGPRRARVADLWPVESGRGHLRAAERRLPLSWRERRGDLPEHLQAGLQLPQGLLPGRQPGGPGLRLPASEDRPGQKAPGRPLPPGAVAAGWPRRRPGRGLLGHLPPHFFHWQEKTSDRCPAHRRGQELHSRSPSASGLSSSQPQRSDHSRRRCSVWGPALRLKRLFMVSM